MNVILASGSPRRKELLRQLIAEFQVIPSEAEEHTDANTPREAVVELSRGKAERVAKKHPADLVIGADTVVYCDGKILGKPGTVQEAQKMLSMLSGRKHVVYTGVTVISPNGVHTDTACTEVYFAHMSREEMEQYIATGDCFDKAGGYGIQGYAARFIEKIDGDYFNVVGLPLRLTYRLLKKAGVRM